MRTNTIAFAEYTPAMTPSAYNAFYLQLELEKIAAAVARLSAGHIAPSNVAPDKPRNGDIRYADGTDWNPGSGEGFYGYESGAWVKL